MMVNSQLWKAHHKVQEGIEELLTFATGMELQDDVYRSGSTVHQVVTAMVQLNHFRLDNCNLIHSFVAPVVVFYLLIASETTSTAFSRICMSIC